MATIMKLSATICSRSLSLRMIVGCVVGRCLTAPQGVSTETEKKSPQEEPKLMTD